jgi:hypothetical protein
LRQSLRLSAQKGVLPYKKIQEIKHSRHLFHVPLRRDAENSLFLASHERFLNVNVFHGRTEAWMNPGFVGTSPGPEETSPGLVKTSPGLVVTHGNLHPMLFLTLYVTNDVLFNTHRGLLRALFEAGNGRGGFFSILTAFAHIFTSLSLHDKPRKWSTWNVFHASGSTASSKLCA